MTHRHHLPLPGPDRTDTTFVILLGRTPVVGATVYEDRDGDGQLSPQERQTPVGVTGAGGLVTVPTAGKDTRHLAQFRKPQPERASGSAPDSDSVPEPDQSPRQQPPPVPELGMWGLVAPARRDGAGPDEDIPVSARIGLLLLESRLQPRQSETGDSSDKAAPRIRVLIADRPPSRIRF